MRLLLRPIFVKNEKENSVFKNDDRNRIYFAIYNNGDRACDVDINMSSDYKELERAGLKLEIPEKNKKDIDRGNNFYIIMDIPVSFIDVNDNFAHYDIVYKISYSDSIGNKYSQIVRLYSNGDYNVYVPTLIKKA